MMTKEAWNGTARRRPRRRCLIYWNELDRGGAFAPYGDTLMVTQPCLNGKETNNEPRNAAYKGTQGCLGQERKETKQ
jgi:hypothetical protein